MQIGGGGGQTGVVQYRQNRQRTPEYINKILLHGLVREEKVSLKTAM